MEHLTVSQGLLEERGIPVVPTERGGSITYHGPGQLIGYPIVDLHRARLGVPDFVTALEEVMIRTSRDFGVLSERSPVNRGVWVGNRKLGSVGLAVRRGISFHGFALNVNPSLEPFTWVQPCGLQGVKMTSLRRELGEALPMANVRQCACSHIQAVFDVALEPVAVEHVLRLLGGIPKAPRAVSLER
jgi:lipoate-protein ligase B